MAPVGRVLGATGRTTRRVELSGPSCTSARRSAATRSPARRRASGPAPAARRPTTSGRRASRCRRSCGGPPSPSPSSTTTCSARARSTTTREMLWVRSVEDRLTKLAPFLSYDGDPYPVADGRAGLWVVDAYTTTSRYPYAQRIGNDVQLTAGSGLDRDANYVRNSVKAVVDAYDGSVKFYVRTSRTRSSRRGRAPSATCSRRGDQMPAGAAPAPALPRGPVPGADRRLLEVPARRRTSFFEREGAWSVAQAPSVDPRESTSRRRRRRRRRATSRRPRDLASESSTARFIAVLHAVPRRLGRRRGRS